jgi:hypothetical protein
MAGHCSMSPRHKPATPPEAPPPLLRSWRNLYLLLLAELGVLILLFFALTRWAS